MLVAVATHEAKMNNLKNASQAVEWRVDASRHPPSAQHRTPTAASTRVTASAWAGCAPRTGASRASGFARSAATAY